MSPPSTESILSGGLFSLSSVGERERSREIIAAYNAGYDFATGRYSPPQDADIDPNKKDFIFMPSPTSNLKSREIYKKKFSKKIFCKSFHIFLHYPMRGNIWQQWQ